MQGGGIELPVKDGQTYYPPQQIWNEYLMVSPDSRFRYDVVWQNQGEDVHPPLFYMLLHTVCSFFPGIFSIWFGMVVNVVFACGTLFFVRKLIFLLTQDKWVRSVGSLAFVCSAGILFITTFVRMYTMTLFWTIALTYVLVRRIGYHHRPGDYAAIFLCTVGGALTHYYCIIYAVLLCVVYGILLLYEKRWKETGLFCLTQGIAALTAILIFPAMINHLFFGYRGVQAFGNMTSENLTDSIGKLIGFLNKVDCELFGGLLVYFMGMAFVLLCVYAYRKRNGAILCMDKIALKRYLCCIGACALFFLAISRVGIQASARYISPIYSVVFSIVVCGVSVGCKAVMKQEYVRTTEILILLIFTIASWRNQEWEHFYRSTGPLLETAEQYPNVDCICIYDGLGRVATAYREACEYHSITFYKTENLEQLSLSDLSLRCELMVMLDMTVDKQEALERVMEICPNLDAYEYLGEDVHTSTYYMHAATE